MLIRLTVALSLLVVTDVANAQKPKLGVVLNFSGVMAISERANLDEIKAKFPQFEVVAMDAGSRVGVAPQMVAQLQKEGVAGVLLGGVPAVDVEIIAKAKPSVPVISLTPVLDSGYAKFLADQGVTVFTQPREQASRVASSFGSGVQPFVVVADTLPPASRPRTGGSTIPMKVFKYSEISAVVADAQQSPILGVADPTSGVKLFTGMKESSKSGVVVTPPSQGQLLNVVSSLGAQWATKGSVDARSWSEVKRSSAYVESGTYALAYGWTVSAQALALPSGQLSDQVCRCKSRDGTVTQETYCQTPPESCVTQVSTSDCSCSCR